MAPKRTRFQKADQTAGKRCRNGCVNCKSRGSRLWINHVLDRTMRSRVRSTLKKPEVFKWTLASWPAGHGGLCPRAVPTPNLGQLVRGNLQRPPHGADSCASRRSRHSPGACSAMGAINRFVHGLRTSAITESPQWSHRPSAADRRLCCKALFVACPARSVFLTAPDELEHPGDRRSYPLSNQPRVYVSLRGVLPIPYFAFSCSTEKFDWCTDQHP